MARLSGCHSFNRNAKDYAVVMATIVLAETVLSSKVIIIRNLRWKIMWIQHCRYHFPVVGIVIAVLCTSRPRLLASRRRVLLLFVLALL